MLVGVLLVAGVAGGVFIIGQHAYLNPFFTESRVPAQFFWIHPLFVNESYQVLQQHHDRIDMVSPVWYHVHDNGSLVDDHAGDPATRDVLLDMVTFCHANNITVHPLVTKGSNEAVRVIVLDPTAREAFITSTVQHLDSTGADGLNVDFEGIDADLRATFPGFYRELRDRLAAIGKVVSIAVPALESDALSGWGGWCDYVAIGAVDGMFMIMTYDAHGGWTGPGEVAPVSWVQRVLAHAVRRVPVGRIFVGIPFYGYDWSEDPAWQNWGFGHGFFVDRQATFGGTTSRTPDGDEVRLEYVDGNGFAHVAYYCDARTTATKIAFLARYPVGGYCYWHLSCGDPAFFALDLGW